MKKVISAVLSVVMSVGLLAGCGGKADSGVSISFLNSKGEIQESLEKMASEYSKKTGVNIDIVACGSGESPYTKITSAYNSGNPPTMAMLDTTDVIALAKDKAVDLSNEKWVAELGDNVRKIDGTVYSFPFCVEGRGIIYNGKAIEDTLGRKFDPSSINSYDSLKALLEELRSKGMENPVVISKEDWSLGAHQLQYVYETQDGEDAGAEKMIEDLKNGTVKVEDNDRFKEFVKTLDLLLEYNINKKDPLGAIYEQDPIFLADGEAALWVNGTWAWPNLEEAGANADDNYGFIPYVLGNDTTDFANLGMQACATKQVMIDKVKATDEQIQAAKDFLNYIIYDEDGQKALVEDCALIPVASNNSYELLDPLGRDVKKKMNDGKVYRAAAIVPGDHWSVLGAQMQKYIAKQCTADELAAAIDSYWTSQK